MSAALDTAAGRRRRPLHAIGAVLMTLIVAMALLGVWGNGPLSEVHTRAGGLAVDHDRFAREYGQTSFDIGIGPQQSRDGTATLTISQDLLSRYEITAITPEPTSTTSAAGSHQYEFDTAGEEFTVTFDLRPTQAGASSGTASTGEDDVAVRQFVYP